MLDFKIRRGPSSTFFSEPGVVNPRLIIEEGCWYLVTDKAELYLGILDDSGTPKLQKINEVALEPDMGGSSTTQLEFQIKDLEARLDTLDSFELYQKIYSESDLPTNFDSDDFNPNITYYIQLGDNKICTYVYDNDTQSYMCTNSVDELVIRAMVTEALDLVLDEALETKVSQLVKQTIETTILYGGDATPDN